MTTTASPLGEGNRSLKASGGGVYHDGAINATAPLLYSVSFFSKPLCFVHCCTDSLTASYFFTAFPYPAGFQIYIFCSDNS